MKNIIFVQKCVIRHPTEKNKVLVLIRNRNDESRPGDFDIPGGSADEEETNIDGLKREIREETGLEVENIKPIIVKGTPHRLDEKYFLYICYSADALSEKIEINTEEHEFFEWITLEDFEQKAPGHAYAEQIRVGLEG